MIRTALLSSLLVACSTAEPPAPQQPVTEKTSVTTTIAGNRAVTKRDALPAAVKPFLPKNGIYAAGGGLMSSPWRIVVDLDQKLIYVGSSQGANKPSTGTLEKEASKDLSPRNASHLMGLAHTAWIEPAPARPSPPIADYDETLIVLEGDDTFYLKGYGPIRRPDAAKLIVELRAAAGL